MAVAVAQSQVGWFNHLVSGAATLWLVYVHPYFCKKNYDFKWKDHVIKGPISSGYRVFMYLNCKKTHPKSKI